MHSHPLVLWWLLFFFKAKNGPRRPSYNTAERWIDVAQAQVINSLCWRRSLRTRLLFTMLALLRYYIVEVLMQNSSEDRPREVDFRGKVPWDHTMPFEVIKRRRCVIHIVTETGHNTFQDPGGVHVWLLQEIFQAGWLKEEGLRGATRSKENTGCLLKKRSPNIAVVRHVCYMKFKIGGQTTRTHIDSNPSLFSHYFNDE